MKVLIIGHTGFVGQNVMNELKTYYEVVGYSRINGLDLLDLKSFKLILEKERPDTIINCAAKVGSLNYVTQIAADILDINLRILLNIYKGIEQTNRKIILINPVANCAFPGNLNEYYEDDLWNGRIHQSVLAYGSTRRMMDVFSECYKMQYGIKSILLFVPNMYGPFDSTDPNKAHALNALVGRVVKAKSKNEDIEVWGSGLAIREWLFAPDFAKIIKIILDNKLNLKISEPLNIAQHFGLSISDLVEIIIDATNFNAQIIWNRSMPDGAPKKVMNDLRFRKFFPRFEFTTLDIGLKKTIEYYTSRLPY